MLGDFLDVFLFEEQPAKNRTAKSVFLEEVAACDVYLGLFGSKYGSRGKDGVLPANSYIKRLVASLVDDGLAETTGERKRGARLQKYRLTAKGRKVAATFTKNADKPKGNRDVK